MVKGTNKLEMILGSTPVNEAAFIFFQRSIRVEPDSPQGLSVWHPSGRWAGSVGLTQSVASEAPGGEESFGEEKRLWQFIPTDLKGRLPP